MLRSCTETNHKQYRNIVLFPTVQILQKQQEIGTLEWSMEVAYLVEFLKIIDTRDQGRRCQLPGGGDAAKQGG